MNNKLFDTIKFDQSVSLSSLKVGKAGKVLKGNWSMEIEYRKPETNSVKRYPKLYKAGWHVKVGRIDCTIIPMFFVDASGQGYERKSEAVSAAYLARDYLWEKANKELEEKQ